MTCWGAANAQTLQPPTTGTPTGPTTARIVETLSEGRGWILEINGVQIRGVGAERWRELLAKEIKADTSAEAERLNNALRQQFVDYINSLEQRAKFDQELIGQLTKSLGECQQNKTPTGKTAVFKELAGATWQLFLWYRALK